MATLETLLTWTPFLMEGFGWNVVIAFTAGLIGLALGVPLAYLMQARARWVAGVSQKASGVIHYLPTFALIFYMAVLLPAEVTLPGLDTSIRIPTWFKVALALSAMQVGYVSENFAIALQAWRQGDAPKALLFIPGWINGFLITAIASSNASVVGVNELVSRCNTVIAATGQTDLMIPVYLYASLFFLAFCFPLSWLVGKLKKKLAARVAKAQAG
ncbi:MAG TPA: polar amino acid ABC transporter permease [Burkholderiaceae bacterium]|nr:polar amino acid ABC transporter permease [Burkholderiaceae bacterium]